MLNSNMNYPYPMLRTKPVDYKSSVFESNVSKENSKDGYYIKVDFKVANSEIEELLNSNVLSYAVQLQCTSTWYRELKLCDSDSFVFFLPSQMVHNRVDLCPCIIALKKIEDFSNSDFSEDFDGISYEINKGEAVAIGERQRFDAIYKSDIIKKGDPIVHFVNDDRCTVMFCEWEYDTIRIHLPKEQYEKYNNVGKYEPWKVPILNSIYVVPAIVQGIYEIFLDVVKNGSGTLENYSWYTTLKVMIQKLANDSDEEFRKMLHDPIKTAQRLMNDNSRQSLEILSAVSKQ